MKSSCHIDDKVDPVEKYLILLQDDNSSMTSIFIRWSAMISWSLYELSPRCTTTTWSWNLHFDPCLKINQWKQRPNHGTCAKDSWRWRKVK